MRSFSRRAAAVTAAVIVGTGLLVGGTGTAAMAEPSGFCGAVIQGHDAWYKNCTAVTVRKAADFRLAPDPCATIKPGATKHWRDPAFNIRGIYSC